MSTRSKKPKTKLSVGVTLHIRNGAQSLWENGIFQNCLFLVMLLQQAPHVGEVFLVHGGGGTEQQRQQLLEGFDFPFLSMEQAQNRLDVAIEMSAQFDPLWVTAFQERGGKVIAAHVGNDYVIDIERMIFNKPHAHLMSGSPYDEIWTLAEYERTAMPYYAAATGIPVAIMPHLWSPMVLERTMARNAHEVKFAYQPGKHSWNMAIFEPNVSMVKTSFVPLMACEVAHRRNPNAIEKVYAFNTAHLRNNKEMQGFCDALSLQRHGLIEYGHRAATFEVMTRVANAVVSHQWENAQNYLYYELLWGGYPLIHNSPFVGSCGYYYSDFDCEEAGLAILQALSVHDLRLDDYRRSAQQYLHTVDPLNPDNIAWYDQAIMRLFTSSQ